MSNITKYLEQKLLAQSVGKITNFSIANCYVGLFSVSPTVAYLGASTNGTELNSTGIGYQRISAPSTSWNNAVDNNDTTNSSKITNAVDFTWTATGSWPVVTTVGIFDGSASASNLLWFGPLSMPSGQIPFTSFVNNDTFTIPASSLTLTLA